MKKVAIIVGVLVALFVSFAGGAILGARRAMNLVQPVMMADVNFNLKQNVYALFLTYDEDTDHSVRLLNDRVFFAMAYLGNNYEWSALPQESRETLVIAKQFLKAHPPKFQTDREKAFRDLMLKIPDEPLDVDMSTCNPYLRRLLKSLPEPGPS